MSNEFKPCSFEIKDAEKLPSMQRVTASYNSQMDNLRAEDRIHRLAEGRNPCGEILLGNPEIALSYPHPSCPLNRPLTQDEISMVISKEMEKAKGQPISRTPTFEPCKDCKGTGEYVGFNSTEVCSRCNGSKYE